MIAVRLSGARFLCCPARAPFGRGIASLSEMSERPVIRASLNNGLRVADKVVSNPRNAFRRGRCGRFFRFPPITVEADFSRKQKLMRPSRGSTGLAPNPADDQGAGWNYVFSVEIDKLRNNWFMDQTPNCDDLSEIAVAEIGNALSKEAAGSAAPAPRNPTFSESPSSRNAPASGRWCSRHRCSRHHRRRRLPARRGICSPR
jgi:hypothetical protein